MTNQSNLIKEVKDAAKAIYTELGGGYLETIYEEAMAIELRERNIEYEVERNREIFYKEVKVGTHRLDFIIKEKLVVELKATGSIQKTHVGQTHAYLKATGIKQGLIINFPYPEEDEPQFKLIPDEG